MTVPCLASPGLRGAPEVPLYECPCAECTTLEWRLLRDLDGPKVGTLRDFRRATFPEVWT